MDLVQMRMIDNGTGAFILQWRSVQPMADASGAICGFGDWGEWQTVPTVHVGEKAASLVDSFPSLGAVNK